jgi:hypothetical protein
MGLDTGPKIYRKLGTLPDYAFDELASLINIIVNVGVISQKIYQCRLNKSILID